MTLDPPLSEEPRPSTRGITKNTLGLSAIQFSIKALSAVWTFYLAWRLGAALYGQWASMLALAAIFGVIQGCGISGIVFKDISQKRRDAGEVRRYFGASLLVFGATSLLAFLLVIIAGLILGYRSDKLALAALAGASIPALCVGLSSQSILYGLERFLQYNWTYIVYGTGTYLLLGVLAVESGCGVRGVFAALAIAYACMSWSLYRQTVRACGTPDFAGDGALIRRLCLLGLPLMLNAFLMESMLRADRILIDRYLGEAAVGYYHAVFNVMLMPREILLIPFVTATSARLYAHYAQDPAAFRKLFGQVNLGVVLMVLPIIGFCSLFPMPIVRFFYGKGFQQAAGLLPILDWTMLPLFLVIVWQNLFIIQDRTRMILGVNAAGTVFYLLANHWGLPRWGVEAAAWSSLSTQVLILLLSILLSGEKHLLDFLPRIPKVALSCACATILLSFARPFAEAGRLPLAAVGLAGAGLYLLFLRLFGAATAEELDWLKRQRGFLTDSLRYRWDRLRGLNP